MAGDGAATFSIDDGEEFPLQLRSISQIKSRVESPVASIPVWATDSLAYAGVAVAGALLAWLCRTHASVLPFWAPWDFSWIEFLSAWLTVWWYIRGVGVAPPDRRPSLARQISFFAGILVVYAVLETRFEYYAEHQFFLHRIQHVAMHHLGPVLIALSWPGAEIKRAMPAPLRRVIEHPMAARTVSFLQQPLLAAFLFVGLIFFWLIPSIHFRAMLDANLYALMNWSMVIDGILFWCLVLDPRPSPPARVTFGMRAALTVLVMFPQIAGGAFIAFDARDLFSFYDLCGRIYAGLGARYDQAIGGLIIWIPPAMMSVMGLVLVLNALRRTEESNLSRRIAGGDDSAMVAQAGRWTGM